jgi:hypothetical protein
VTEQQLKLWAMSNQDIDPVARAVVELLGRLAEVDWRCRPESHYFGGGQWKCNCEKYTRADFGGTDADRMPPAIHANEPPVPDRAPDFEADKKRLLKELGPMKFTDITGTMPAVVDSPAFNGSTGTPEHAKAGYAMGPQPGTH